MFTDVSRQAWHTEHCMCYTSLLRPSTSLIDASYALGMNSPVAPVFRNVAGLLLAPATQAGPGLAAWHILQSYRVPRYTGRHTLVAAQAGVCLLQPRLAKLCESTVERLPDEKRYSRTDTHYIYTNNMLIGMSRSGHMSKHTS